MRRLLQQLLWTTLFFGIGAGAGFAQPARLGLPKHSDVCVERGGQKIVDPRKLVAYYVKESGLSLAALDGDNDDTITYDEQRTAITSQRYCRGNSKCGVAASKQGSISFTLQDLADGKAAGFEVRRNGVKATVDPMQLTDKSPASQVSIVCLVAAQPQHQRQSPAKTEDPKKEDPSKGGKEDEEKKDPYQGWRLVGKLEHLTVVKGFGKSAKRNVSALNAAEFAATNDRRSNDRTYQVRAFAGYAFNTQFGDISQNRWLFAPFVQVERLDSKKKKGEVDKIGAGAISELWLDMGGPTYELFTFAPHFITDSKANTKMLTFKGSWVPSFFYFPGSWVNWGQSCFEAFVCSLDPRILVTYGHVFRAGRSTEVREVSDYVRVGGEIGFTIRGAENTFLNKFELSAYYRYLKSLSGHIGHSSFFKASLSYMFVTEDGKPVENYVIKAEYSNGRVDDTLKRIDLFMVSFGIRF